MNSTDITPKQQECIQNINFNMCTLISDCYKNFNLKKYYKSKSFKILQIELLFLRNVRLKKSVS